MKYYKSPNNKIYVYESDGSQDSYIPSDYVQITKEEADNLIQQNMENQYNNLPVEEKKAICKTQASRLLYETDWTTIPDVVDPANTPYLKNQAEFIAWRSQIRALAVNPVADPVFPTKPKAVWV
jgi:hypothetical protein